MAVKKTTTTRKPSSRKTTAKPAARRAAPAKKTVVMTPAEQPATQATQKPAVQGVTLLDPNILNKKQLIEDVVVRSGIKKKDAKPVIEAMLDVLGQAIADGKNLNLQPFGKITQQKQNEKASARVTIVRIRQPNARPEKVVKDPLAEAAE